jgi:hypothetical protein
MADKYRRHITTTDSSDRLNKGYLEQAHKARSTFVNMLQATALNEIMQSGQFDVCYYYFPDFFIPSFIEKLIIPGDISKLDSILNKCNIAANPLYNALKEAAQTLLPDEISAFKEHYKDSEFISYCDIHDTSPHLTDEPLSGSHKAYCSEQFLKLVADAI